MDYFILVPSVCPNFMYRRGYYLIIGMVQKFLLSYPLKSLLTFQKKVLGHIINNFGKLHTCTISVDLFNLFNMAILFSSFRDIYIHFLTAVGIKILL